MCEFRKFIGVASLSLSLFYTVLSWFIFIPFALRCFDDCSGADENASEILSELYSEDCFGSGGVYRMFIPPALFGVLIVLADYGNTYYLEWWLVCHLVATCAGVSLVSCYFRFYDFMTGFVSIISISILIMSFAFVACHYVKLRLKSTQNLSPTAWNK